MTTRCVFALCECVCVWGGRTSWGMLCWLSAALLLSGNSIDRVHELHTAHTPTHTPKLCLHCVCLCVYRVHTYPFIFVCLSENVHNWILYSWGVCWSCQLHFCLYVCTVCVCVYLKIARVLVPLFLRCLSKPSSACLCLSAMMSSRPSAKGWDVSRLWSLHYWCRLWLGCTGHRLQKITRWGELWLNSQGI